MYTTKASFLFWAYVICPYSCTNVDLSINLFGKVIKKYETLLFFQTFISSVSKIEYLRQYCKR